MARNVGEVVDLESWLARDLQRRTADRELHARPINAALAEAGGSDTLLLHDRRRGPGHVGSEIHHLAVTQRGVWLIEARYYAGLRVDVVWASGAEHAERERLLVNGHDRTLMVKALDSQLEDVRHALAAYEVPVGALLCFVGAQLPRVWSPSIHGYPVRDPEGTAELLQAPGHLDPARRREILHVLAEAFPAL